MMGAHRARGSRDMSDLPQRNHDSDGWKGSERGFEVIATVCDFERLGLVRRRKAFNGIEDDRALEPEAIVRIAAKFTSREPKLQQRRVKQLPREISGEWPSRPVGPMLPGREANDGEPGVRIAECRNRRIPPVGMFTPQLLPQAHQPRAQRAVARRFGFGERREVGGSELDHSSNYRLG